MPLPAPDRIGHPSPLIFHLGAALSAYTQALMAAPRSDSDAFPWADGLGERAASLGSDLDQIEIACEMASRLRMTLDGLDVWQRHPYRRSLEDPPAIWQRGSSRILDYGYFEAQDMRDARPVLVVPSLINRAYILDLAPNRSLLRWMAAHNLRPFLLDWGAPGPAEASFTLHDYGADRLAPAFAFVREVTDRPVSLLGYCMGGTLAAGFAACKPEGLARLATIGAPWDFGSTDGLAGALRATVRAQGGLQTQKLLETLAAAFGFIPVSLFQTLFSIINPLQATLKFQRLARLDPDGPAAQFFVALEDWLADGVPMPLGAAVDLLLGWQVENRTAHGEWEFLGRRIRLSEIDVPSICFCGRRDSIAPPALSEALPCQIPSAHTIRPNTGHVGMVVGSGARVAVWRRLDEFLVA
ncbi:MAG: alpha/beta fold hydrolase [Pseudomonadota bacterium]